ncbi:MAG: hypothetical protein V3R84_10430 [Acidimicrobiia bacterium]
MRRYLGVFMVVAMAAAACGDSGEESAGAQEPDSTNAATAQGSVADLAITEIVFGDHVTITNLGDAAVSVDGLWLCNRPGYTELPTAAIAAGSSLDIPADALGSLPGGGGEVALYTSNSFGDSSAMLDYVAWGSGGGRASVAEEAGLWPAGDSVDVAGSEIMAATGGAAAGDWSS